jgi:hypothetical protein
MSRGKEGQLWMGSTAMVGRDGGGAGGVDGSRGEWWGWVLRDWWDVAADIALPLQSPVLLVTSSSVALYQSLQ